MSEVGMVIAQDGMTLSQGMRMFDSRNKHMQVNLLKDPSHIQLQDVFPTAIVTSSGTPNWNNTETLFTMRHNLPYKPRVFAFFYIKTYDGGTTDASVGQYGERIYFAFGAVDDYMWCDADADNIYIKHTLQDYFNLGYTSTGNHYGIQAKILICSNGFSTVV